MTHSMWFKITLLFAVIFGSLPSSSAQDENFFARDRYVSVTEREQPAFDPQPIRLGVFDVRPELTTGLGFTSNLFFDPDNGEADGFVQIRPSVSGETTWSRNQIGFDVNLNFNEFFSNSSETITNFNTRAFGRLDIGPDAQVTAGVFGGVQNEPRSASAAAVDAVEPIRIVRYGAELDGQYQTGRLRLGAGVIATKSNFEDVELIGGGELDQDFRDRVEIIANGRAAWAIQRDLAIVGRIAYTDRETSGPTILAPLDRDSNGVSVEVGANFELPVLLRGEVTVGYQSFNFDAVEFGSLDGLAVNANVQWFPTQLTTVSANVAREVIDPGLNASAGAFRTGVRVGVDHELRRNILLRARAGFARSDFEAIEREDDRYTIGFGALWKINRRIYLDSSYNFTEQNSDIQPFSENRVLFSLRLFL